MNYMTPQEASQKWGICQRQVQELCSKNRIPGVRKINRRWFIPVNAERPEDARIYRSASAQEAEAYHFPIFIYSDYYSAEDELSPEERKLFKAQILTIQNKFLDSVKICRELCESCALTSVRFGALCTNVYNYTVLGQYSEISVCMNSMKKIIEAEDAHKYDYQFLFAVCHCHYSTDPSKLLEIETSKLSSEAIIAYECAIMEIKTMSLSEETSASIQIYSALCRQMEDSGVLPAAMVAHGVLAMLCKRINDIEKTEYHVKKICRIGFDNNYFKLVSKYSVFLQDIYNKYISEYGNDCVKNISKNRQNNMNGWRLTYNTMNNKRVVFNHPVRDSEYLLLIYYGLNNREIAELKNISQRELNDTIKRICAESECKNKSELVKYTRRVMSISNNL